MLLTHTYNCGRTWFCNYGGNYSASQLQLSGSAAPRWTQMEPVRVSRERASHVQRLCPRCSGPSSFIPPKCLLMGEMLGEERGLDLLNLKSVMRRLLLWIGAIQINTDWVIWGLHWSKKLNPGKPFLSDMLTLGFFCQRHVPGWGWRWIRTKFCFVALCGQSRVRVIQSSPYVHERGGLEHGRFSFNADFMTLYGCAQIICTDMKKSSPLAFFRFKVVHRN